MKISTTCNLIHYTKLKSRLPKAIDAIHSLNLEPNIITICDGDNVNSFKQYLNQICINQQQIWEYQISKIAPILLANVHIQSTEINQNLDYREIHSKYCQLLLRKHILLPQWCSFRELNTGELSVLLKHYHAISLIANSPYDFGFIFEDDVRLHALSKDMFDRVIHQINLIQPDYVDLAGGCNLLVPNSTFDAPLLQRIQPSRTRTNAAYGISKKCANFFINNYFPLVFPIDWHLQYLFSQNIELTCYWCKDLPLIHGSEVGLERSWR